MKRREPHKLSFIVLCRHKKGTPLEVTSRYRVGSDPYVRLELIPKSTVADTVATTSITGLRQTYMSIT
jgi:hypothetical protein